MTPTVKSFNKAFANFDEENFVKLVRDSVYPYIDVRLEGSNENGASLLLPWTITQEYEGTPDKVLEMMAKQIGSDLGHIVENGDTEIDTSVSRGPLLVAADGLKKKYGLTSRSEVKRVAYNHEVVLSDLEFKAKQWKDGTIYLTYKLKAELKKKDL